MKHRFLYLFSLLGKTRLTIKNDDHPANYSLKNGIVLNRILKKLITLIELFFYWYPKRKRKDEITFYDELTISRVSARSPHKKQFYQSSKPKFKLFVITLSVAVPQDFIRCTGFFF